jgi:hypothetical protein
MAGLYSVKQSCGACYTKFRADSSYIWQYFSVLDRNKLWLAGAIAAVAIAGVSLALVRGGVDEARPRAGAAPPPAGAHAPAPQPLERPILRHEPAAPVEQAAPAGEAPAAPAPTRKPRRPAHKDGKDAKDGKDGKPAAAKKWDPDALFPQ